MDKELRELKNDYLNDHSIQFTEQDRDGVLQKINQSKKSNKTFTPTRVALTLAAVFLIGFTILFSQLNGEDTPSGLGNNTEPAIEGYVLQKEENGSILVVSSETNQYNQYDAVWYRGVTEEVELGRKIKGWHSEQEDSFPAQASADRIELLPDESVPGATLTKKEVIVKVLNSDELTEFGYDFVAIKEINFIENKQIWEVIVSNLSNDSFITIQIQDNSNEDISESENLNLDYAKYGKRFPELEEKFIDYMNGPNRMLNALGIELNGVAIDEEGTVTVDFKPFSYSFTTNESGEFNNEMKEIVFSFENVNQVYFQENGDKEIYYRKFESFVQPLTNKDREPTSFNEKEFFNRYDETFNQFIQNNEQQRLTTFDSLTDVKVELLNIASNEYAKELMDTYFYEEEDGVYLVATHTPTSLSINEPYDVNKIDEKTYEIKQEHISDLDGHVIYTFTIVFNGANWVLHQVEYDMVYESIKTLLTNYEQTFMHLVNNNENQRLTTYNSAKEVRVDFLKVMTDKQADQLMDDYIYEQDGDVYLTATIMPVFIDMKKDFSLNQIDRNTYQVEQEHSSDLRGNVTFIFTIKKKDYQWFVDEVEVEQR
ncbi:DUF3221 domain-containing protein [Bacillaceae bacterium W0354]